MKSVLFVGWVNEGKAPVDGETTKNQYIIAELEKYCKVKVLDFYDKKSHPWIYLQAMWAFMTMPKATIIFSTTATNVYSILKLLQKIHLHRTIIHWVIGGSFGSWLLNGKLDSEVFKGLKFNLVQCKGMIKELEDAGLRNVKYVSNFKPISYYPDATIKKKQENCFKNRPIRFVFVSRIMPEKGCDYIIDAVRELNNVGLMDKYSIDFYGKIAPNYEEKFKSKISNIANVKFYGLLNLKEKEGYDTLATYDAMLFPTYWRGEGFAGIFIDSFISGVPILASDWAHNPEAIDNGRLGILYKTHDINALKEVMLGCIDGKYDLVSMSKNCRKEAPQYNAEVAINEEYLKSIGLI